MRRSRSPIIVIMGGRGRSRSYGGRRRSYRRRRGGGGYGGSGMLGSPYAGYWAGATWRPYR